MKKLLFCIAGFVCFVWNMTAQNTNTSLPGWITRPLSLTDCLNIALSAKRHDPQGQERS